MRSAVKAVRADGPASVVATVPVSSLEAQSINRVCDVLICLHTPGKFHAAGAFHEQLPDDDAVRLLERANPCHTTYPTLRQPRVRGWREFFAESSGGVQVTAGCGLTVVGEQVICWFRQEKAMSGAGVRNGARLPARPGQYGPGPGRLLLIDFGQEILLSFRMEEPVPGPGEFLLGFTSDDVFGGSVRCLGIRFSGGRVLGSFDLLHASPYGRLSAPFGREDGSTDATFLLGCTVSAFFPLAGLTESDVARMYPFTVRDGRLAGRSPAFARLGG